MPISLYGVIFDILIDCRCQKGYTVRGHNDAILLNGEKYGIVIYLKTMPFHFLFRCRFHYFESFRENIQIFNGIGDFVIQDRGGIIPTHSSPKTEKPWYIKRFRLFTLRCSAWCSADIRTIGSVIKTNRKQVKLFFFVNPCSLTFALGAEGWRLCVVALQTMISKMQVKRSKVKMHLKASKTPYNPFYTLGRVEIPPK